MDKPDSSMFSTNSDMFQCSDGNVRVLLSLAAPDGTTRFVDQLVTYAHPCQETKYFSWRSALIGKYDVFHVHWPEYLVRADRKSFALAKYILCSLFILRLRVQKIPVLRTVHNLEPHEPGSKAEQFLLRKLDSLVRRRVVLNPLTPASNSVLIAHGHYIDRFSSIVRSDQVPNRICYFGIIKPYKNVETLLHAFCAWENPVAELHIVGMPTNYTSQDVLDAETVDKRIVTRFAFVPDEDLVREICESELIVLPYAEMHNSGAMLVALSLARPVLTPANAMAEWIRSEVGDEWIITYTGPLTSKILNEALERAQSIPSNLFPSLGGRDWETIASKHFSIYRELKGIC